MKPSSIIVPGSHFAVSMFRKTLLMSILLLSGCSGGGGDGDGVEGGGVGGVSGVTTLASMNHEITYDKVSDSLPVAVGVQINTNFAARHENVEIVFNSSGVGMAVWTTVTTDHTDVEKIVYSVYEPSVGAWSPEQTLFVVTNVTVPKTKFSLAASDNGFAIAWSVNGVYSVTDDNVQVWNDYNYAKIYSGGSWSRAYLLNSSDYLVYLSSPVVSSNGSSFLFAWREDMALVSREWNNGAFSNLTLAYSAGVIGVEDLQLASNGAGYMLKVEHGTNYYSSRFMVAVPYNNGSWGTADTTETSLGNISRSKIVSDGNGYMMTWIQDGSANYRVYANNSWSAMTAIVNGPTGLHGLVSNSNSYLLSWISSGRLNVKTYSNGSWGDTEFPESITGAISSAEASPTSSGYSFALRVNNSGLSVYDLYLLNYNGGASGVDVLVDQLDFNVISQQIAYGDGQTWLAWQQFDGNDMQLKARSYQNATPLTPEQTLNKKSHSAGVKSGKSVITAGGLKVAAWSQTYFDATGTERWAAFARVDDYTGALGAVTHLRDYAKIRDIVKIGENVIVLLDVINGLYAIQYINGSWSPVTMLSSNYVYDLDYRVANNRLMVVWDNNNNLRSAVFSGESWSSVAAINESSTSTGYFKMADNGEDFMVTWTQFLPTNTAVTPNTYPKNINARFYDASEAAWGSISLIENYESIVGGAGSHITSNGNGFLIAWSRADTTGNPSDVSLHTSLCDSSGSCGAATLTENLSGSIGDIRMKSNGSSYLVVFSLSGQLYSVIHNGSNWSSPSLTPMSGTVRALLTDGADYLAFWTSYGNPVNVTRYSGGWGSTQTIIGADQSDLSSLRHIATDTGYVFAWRAHKPGAFYQIYDLYMIAWDGATWSAAQKVSTGKFSVRSFHLDFVNEQLILSWVQAHETASDEAAPALWEKSFP